MTQISRPFQIALLAMGLFVVVWFIALRGHSAGTSAGGSGSSAAVSAPAPTAAGEAKAAAAPTHVYHGSAPGVEGLTRAINKAHGAVATSQREAKQFENESAQASGASSTAAGAGTSKTGSHTARASATKSPATHRAASQAPAAHRTSPSTTSTVARGAHSSSPNVQASVEKELKQGKVVTILFWNPKATVDRAVQRELQAAGHALGGKIAVHDAHASQVGSFGSITRTIQVDETPTILIVNKSGKTTTLTGLIDAFAIEQAINEARQGGR
jgi:hypothetical protein